MMHLNEIRSSGSDGGKKVRKLFMVEGQIQPEQTESTSADDLRLMVQEPALRVSETVLVINPLPIPHHILFPPGHPMHDASRN